MNWWTEFQAMTGETKMADTTQVVVNVKSPLTSKVNWAAGLTALSLTLTQLLPYIPKPYDHYVTIAIAVIGGGLTIYFKTFATPTVSSASVASIPAVTSEEAQTAGLNNAQLSKAP